MRLARIQRETLDRFLALLLAKTKAGKRKHRVGISAKRAKNALATLRRILASAVDWDVLPTLPRFPKVKTLESRFDFFSDESDKLLAPARSTEERALLVFALHTGARAGEQLALEWTDIDWHNRLVCFRRSATYGIVGPTKSGKERKVPLTATLEATLRAIRHLRASASSATPTARRFPSGSSTNASGARAGAGLRRIRWHDLRHSYASQLVMAALRSARCRSGFGHPAVIMTMRYAHLAPNGGPRVPRCT